MCLILLSVSQSIDQDTEECCRYNFESNVLIFSHVTRNPNIQEVRHISRKLLSNQRHVKRPDAGAVGGGGYVLMGYVKKLVCQVRKCPSEAWHWIFWLCILCTLIQGARVAMRRKVRCELKESSRVLWIISIPKCGWLFSRVLSWNINHTKWKVQHNSVQRSNLRVFSHSPFKNNHSVLHSVDQHKRNLVLFVFTLTLMGPQSSFCSHYSLSGAIRPLLHCIMGSFTQNSELLVFLRWLVKLAHRQREN